MYRRAHALQFFGMIWYLPIAPENRFTASNRPLDSVHARPVMKSLMSTVNCRAPAAAVVPTARHATRSDVTMIVRTLQLPVRAERGHSLDGSGKHGTCRRTAVRTTLQGTGATRG